MLSNFCDAVSYVQLLLFQDKKWGEYFAALFYFMGLTVSLTSNLEKLPPSALKGKTDGTTNFTYLKTNFHQRRKA